MNLKYIPGLIHLLATNIMHKNRQEMYVLLAVVLWKKFTNCALLDTCLDKGAQSRVQECTCIII
jgi:hypothetical protein